ncbi:MAG: ATP-binding protein [Actinobacteria bacterium]|nr:ATP-binding protein [Actinomycetota bacterium]
MLVPRPHYLEMALRFRDTDLIKVVTGVRRCGKSSLLALVGEGLRAEGVEEQQIVSLNLESKSVEVSNEEELYEYFKTRLHPNKKTYIFIDEVQKAKGWENAVNAMRVDFDCDLYVTGSNAYLLSSNLATYISGRYVEIKMLPLVFSEYLSFCNIAASDDALQSDIATGADGKVYTIDALLGRYMQFGGMPKLASLDITQSDHEVYMRSLYDSVVERDVIAREGDTSRKALGSPALLRKICEYLADNAGNITSSNNIANVLTDSGEKTTDKTVSNYVSALVDAYLYYPVVRFDIKGKDLLRTKPKYYSVDTGIRNYLLGYRQLDTGRIFENIVFLQLLFEGYSIHVGKLYSKEVDFIALRDGRTIYIQVVDELFSETTRERELASLRSIRDAYEKWVIVRQGSYSADIEGIRIIPAKDFLLGRT